MKKIVFTAVCVIALSILTGCGTVSKLAQMKNADETKDVMVVGEDISDEDINEFYYTIENINYDAYFLRYKFSNEDGKHMFFFEERERPDDYGPTTEEDTIAKTEFELSDKEWSKFCEIISGGEVSKRNDDQETGGDGPWTYLYWTGDEDEYQEFSFNSQKNRSAFEKLCEKLAKKSGAKAEGKSEPEDPDATVHKAFEQFFEENFTMSSGRESFVTEQDEEGIYYTDYPSGLFGAIDHYIGDLDDDGQDEMIVTQLSADDTYENMFLSVFEYDSGNDRVIQADIYEYGEKMLEPDGGDTFVFLYRYSNYPVIAIMTEDYYYTRADGMNIVFVALNYADDTFTEIAYKDYAGSDMEDNGFAKELKRQGIDITWDDLFEDGLQDRILKVCDGKILAELKLGLDDTEEEDYIPVKLYRHAEVIGYSDASSGNKKKSGKSETIDKKNWKSLEGTEEYEDKNTDDEYIFPDSSDRLLTEDDLKGLSNEELRRGRNEIAARHGRKFSDESLQKYFESKSWYEGTVDADDFNKKVRLNDIELKNMDFIKEHEK